MQLLFFDSFYQDPPDGSVCNSWCIMEFPIPVVLEQISVVPRGASLSEQLQAEGLFGKTAPEHFRIDFFACDEKNEKASTFENLCFLEYNEAILTTAYPRLPFVTTKLVACGKYQSVTLAVFGAEASNIEAIHMIHQRRSEMPSSGPGLLPTPTDSFPKNIDTSRPPPTFSNQSLNQNPPPLIASNAYQSYHSASNTTGPTYGFNNNEYQSNSYNNRGYDNRIRENSKERFYDKTPLLPTPPVGKSNHLSNQDNSNKYPYSGNHYHQQNRDANFQSSNARWPRENFRNFSEENNYSGESDDKKSENYSIKEQEDEDGWEDAEYEEISDEELDEETAASVEAMVQEDMLLPSSMMSYNPFHMESYPLSFFNSPDVTEFEMIQHKLHNQDESESDLNASAKKLQQDKENSCEKLRKLIEDTLKLCPVKTEDKCDIAIKKLSMISSGKEKDFITKLESMIPLLFNGLPYLDLTPNTNFSFIICNWTLFTLQLNNQLSQIIGLNIRALKAGLHLAENLCQTSADIVEYFSTLNLADTLLEILAAKHIASSIKILAIHVLDSLTNWPLQMYEFMFGTEDNSISKSDEASCQLTGYTRIIKLCLQSQTARVASALNQLVRKVHIYESMHEIQVLTQSIILEKIPDEYSYISDEDQDDDIDEMEYRNNGIDIEMDLSSAASAAGTNEEETSSLSEQTNSDNATENLKRKKRGSGPNSSLTTPHEMSLEDNISLEAQAEDVENLVPIEAIFPVSDVALQDKDLDKISDCLQEITSAFSHPQDAIGQFPIKTFPLSQKHVGFVENDDNCKANKTLYRLCEETGLLSSVQALLSLPFVSGHKKLFKSCFLFLNQLMSTKSGLLHLLFNSDSVLHIVHHLLKSSPHLDVEGPNTSGYLGIKLAVHLQSIQSLDHICSLLDSSSDEDETEEELVHDLKTLFSLTYTSFGKKFLSSVLETSGLIKTIIACLWYPAKLSDPDPEIEESNEEEKETPQDNKSDDEDSDDKKDKPGTIQHRNAVNGYASGILHFMLELSDDVTYIYEHVSDLKRACLSEIHLPFRSYDFKKFLSPLNQQLIGDNRDIAKLVGFIKERATLLEWSSLTIDGPGITTALRLLCHLCVKGKTDENCRDAESRLCVLELFSVDCLNVLLTLGEHLHKSLHYFCHGIRPMAGGLLSSTHCLVTSMCQCIFSLLRLLIFHVLDSTIDGKNINKVQITQVAVHLFSDLYILLRPLDSSLLHDIANVVVKVLSLFFADSLPDNDQKSPVIDEMIKHAESQCDNFIPTLLLLSQLLPLPLPIITPEKPAEEARSTVVASCTKWSAIITPHIDDLLSFLLPLSSSIARPVVEVVTTLTQQVIDLSPALALTVVKKYIDDTSPLMVNTSLANKSGDGDSKDDNENEQKELLMLSPEQITAIVTFSELLTLPSAKVAAISVLSSEGEGVMDLWTYAAQPHTPNEDVAAALLLASVLVDTNFFLLPLDGSAASLANVFPPTSHLNAIIDLIMYKISSSSPTIVCRVYLLLTLLQSNKISVPYVRKGITNDDKPLYRGLEKLSDTVDLLDPLWVDAISNFVEFLLQLTNPYLDVKLKKKDPLLSLSFGQLKGLLRWEDKEEHPLRVMQRKVKKFLEADENPDVDFILDQVTCLIQSLNVAKKEKISQLTLPELPGSSPLSDQFADRPIFAIGDSDPILDTRLSITAPQPLMGGAPEAEDELMVQCDLIATASEFCPGYDLAEELGKLAKAVDMQHVAEETEAMEKRRKNIETYSARIGKSLTFIKRSHGLLIAQQRSNRGRGRGINPSNRPYDLFRHRKQNTSRPPSMHVDDFVAADEEQLKMEGEETMFKSPPPPTTQVRRSLNQTFKPRDFVPRGGRGWRISRNTNSYRGRSFSHQGGSNFVSPLNKFRSRPSGVGNNKGVRGQDRFRVMSPRINSRLSFSPREGFKTNKQDQGSWNGGPRDYSSPYRGRGGRVSKPTRGNLNNFSGKFMSSISRRGRGGFKYRGNNKQHIRSSTR